MTQHTDQNSSIMKLEKKPSIFNRIEAVMLAGAIIISLVLISVMGSSMPVISAIWSGACLIMCFGLYMKGRRDWRAMSEEIERQKTFANRGEQTSSELTEALAKSINEQVHALKSISDLNGSDIAMLEKVQEATAEDRLELYLQPIVDLHSTEVKFYEAFSRLKDKDGKLLRPVDYLEAAERANRIGFIDNMILLRSVQAMRSLRETGRNAPVFCNVSPATLYDQSFFSLFTQYLDANQDLSDGLIFEFTYPAISLVDPTIAKSLGVIAERGFGFSVDHIHRLNINLGYLKRLNLRYVKAPVSLLSNGIGKQSQKDEQVETFLNDLKESNVQLIVEKVETADQYKVLREQGFEFGQGNYFGRPMPAKAYLDDHDVKKAS